MRFFSMNASKKSHLIKEGTRRRKNLMKLDSSFLIEEYLSANQLNSLNRLFPFTMWFVWTPLGCTLLCLESVCFSLLATKLPKVRSSGVYMASSASTVEAAEDRSFKICSKSKTMCVTLAVSFGSSVSLCSSIKWR